jgi:GT2 family glycosyltransferase
LFVEQFATGCAMLVRSEVFDIVGFFDEAYFAYSEDADLCLRARANGFTIVHNPRALVTHYPSAATIKNEGKWFRDYYVTRNSFMFGRRHWSGMRRIMFYGYSVVIGFFTPVIYFALTGQLRRIGAVMLGVIDFVRGKDGKRYG